MKKTLSLFVRCTTLYVCTIATATATATAAAATHSRNVLSIHNEKTYTIYEVESEYRLTDK